MPTARPPRAALRSTGPDCRFALVDLAGAAHMGCLVETTTQRLGGARRWIVCPGCLRRRVRLYATTERVRCRVCWALRYATPCEQLDRRLYRRAFALYDRIGTNYRVHPRQHAKPKGMHWRTYWRLRRRAEAFDLAALGAAALSCEPSLSNVDHDTIRGWIRSVARG